MARQIVVRRNAPEYGMSLRDAMDRLFDYSMLRPSLAWRGFGDETLAMDMVETDDALVLKAVVPGVKPEDINISVTGDVLTIQGEIKEEEEVKQHNIHIHERQYGQFSRTVSLPAPVVAEKAEAQFENGILTLKLPKAEEAKPKVITVKAKNNK
jgi:HSP20 family protein